MADMMDTLKGLLGDDADNKLQSIMEIVNPDAKKTAPAVNEDTPADNTGITPEMIKAMQSAMKHIGANNTDDRTKLLMSLKPYMRKSRQDTIDSAVKMLNMSQLSQMFKEIV